MGIKKDLHEVQVFFGSLALILATWLALAQKKRLITKTKANGTSLLEASDVSELGVIINGSHISKKNLYLVLVVMADISCLPQASEIMPIAKIKVKFFSKKILY